MASDFPDEDTGIYHTICYNWTHVTLVYHWRQHRELQTGQIKLHLSAFNKIVLSGDR